MSGNRDHRPWEDAECDAPQRWSRRRFIACVLGMSGLWAGCSRSDPPPVTTRENASLESELTILARPNRFDATLIETFEREFGVAVEFASCESMEELESKLLAGDSKYDLCITEGTVATRLVASGSLHAIDSARVPNLLHLEPRYRGLPWDRRGEFVVPLRARISGIAYRVDKLEVPPDGYSIFQDGRYRRKMVMSSDSREVLGAMLKMRGKSLNSRDAGELEVARQDASLVLKNLREFRSEGAIDSLLSGEVWVAQVTRGDALRAKSRSNVIDWALPKEGGALWVDGMVIPARAPHLNAAHAFLDYLLRPEVAAALARADGHDPVNRDARRLLNGLSPEWSEKQLATLEIPLDLDRDQVIWDRMWTELRSHR